MTTPDLTPILNDLASGRIDAAEAARRIDALKEALKDEPVFAEAVDSEVVEPDRVDPEPTNEELGDESDAGRRQYSPFAREVFAPDTDDIPRAGHGDNRGVERIAVHAVGRRVRVIGDRSVATASAQGPHVLRRNGPVLEVASNGELGPSFDGFSILKPPRSIDDLKSISIGKELLLRVNPAIPVDIEVTAGNLSCLDVLYLGKVRLTAGAADVVGAREFDDVLIQAGSATLRGCLTTGRSRVRCESGQVTVELDGASNVTVRGEVQLGRISWVPNPGGQVDEVVLGNGAARLDVSVIMGWATIKAGEESR